VRGRSYAPRGRTPVVRVCRTRIKLSLITAVTNRGKLRWMVVDGAVNAPTFIREHADWWGAEAVRLGCGLTG
jgi:hypothetical protein